MENHFELLDKFPVNIEVSPQLRSAISKHIEDCTYTSFEYVDDVGTQIIFRFPNDIGASLVVLDEPEPGYSEFEIAVIRFEPDNKNWHSFPENGITDKSGIVRNLSYQDIAETLDAIKGL